MKRFLFVVFILISFIVSLLVYFSFRYINSQLKYITVRGTKIHVEIADSDKTREQGLSNRNSLSENSGMLFIFPKPDYYRFWMKEMEFPLDFLWIENDTVVDFLEKIPPPKDNDEILKTYSPSVKADKVLELNSGKIEKLRIQKGDKIQYHI